MKRQKSIYEIKCFLEYILLFLETLLELKLNAEHARLKRPEIKLLQHYCVENEHKLYLIRPSGF